MEIKAELVLREIAGDYALIPVGESGLAHNGLFSLSETGARIWELLPQAETAEEIVDTLAQEYDAPRETIQTDVTEFLNKMRELNIIA